MSRKLISTKELTLQVIPGPEASGRDIARFSDSFDGFGHWQTEAYCTQAADVLRGEYENEGRLPDSVVLIRTCLFVEQRRASQLMRLFTAWRPGKPNRYVRELLALLRTEVRNGEHLTKWSNPSTIRTWGDFSQSSRNTFAESGTWIESDPNIPHDTVLGPVSQEPDDNHRQDSPEQKIEGFNEAVSLDSNDPQAYFNRGVAHVEQGRL